MFPEPGVIVPSATDPASALRNRPLSLLGSAWPWRCLGYLAVTPVVAFLWLVLGTPLLVLAGVPLGALERWRLRWVDRYPVPGPKSADPASSRVVWRLRHRSTWTALAYGFLLVPVAILDVVLLSTFVLVPASMVVGSAAQAMLLVLGVDPDSVAAVRDLDTPGSEPGLLRHLGFMLLGLLLLALGAYVLVAVTEAQRLLCRALLGPPGGHRRQADDVVRSRARIASAFDEERRRIERDLHDGAQQRLTALVVSLGTIRYQIATGRHDSLERMIERAMDDARDAVEELRDVVHGIYPAALREHDLVGALDELARRAGQADAMSVDVDLTVPARLPTEIEVGLYFAVSELVTNVTRHSGAAKLTVAAWQSARQTLVLMVEDDGHGGASSSGGTGLVGVVDRMETLGGSVRISSPSGGPTRILLEVPCGS